MWWWLCVPQDSVEVVLCNKPLWSRASFIMKARHAAFIFSTEYYRLTVNLWIGESSSHNPLTNIMFESIRCFRGPSVDRCPESKNVSQHIIDVTSILKLHELIFGAVWGQQNKPIKLSWQTYDYLHIQQTQCSISIHLDLCLCPPESDKSPKSLWF